MNWINFQNQRERQAADTSAFPPLHLAGLRRRETSIGPDPDAAVVGLPAWKRALDILCILLASPLLLPVMFIIWAVIKIVSPGPALFRQIRIGFRGQPFTCFKFRTMKVNADTGVHQGHLNRLLESNAPMKKLDSRGDPRLIPCALWIRSLGLDELPQIFNVLRREMSLVGPRPCVPYEYEKFTAEQRRRFAAVPGLTGLWQVSGKNRTTFDEMIALDVFYARHKSLPLDLKIIFKTIPALVSQTKDVRDENRTPAPVPSLEQQEQ